jgi:hypothetical protein
MGFLELAAALKFLRAGELTWLNGTAQILTHDLVMGGYVALAFACGFYLLNLYRLPHDETPVEHLSVPRLLFSLVFISLAFYLLPSLFRSQTGAKQRPVGRVFAWIDSFLLTSPFEDPVVTASGADGRPTRELVWIGNLDKGLIKAANEKKLIFVDFTGINCTNCNINENDVFPQPAIRELLNKYVLVRLYTDAIPNAYQPTTSADENLKLLNDVFKNTQLPFYVILKPRGDGNYDEIERYKEGRITDQDGFTKFLTRPLAAAPDKNKALTAQRDRKGGLALP